MLQNWRLALRSIVRRPAMATAVFLTLTLSIGANSAIFSAIDTVLLKPLPFADPERLVAVYELNGERKGPAALVRLNEWSTLTTSFDGFAGSYAENVADTTGSQPERLAAVRTSARFFTLLGVPAALGRTPREDEHGFGRPNVVVLSDGLWRRRYNADPAIVGRTLLLAGVSRTVIGVMPASFRYPAGAIEAWIPQQLPPAAISRNGRFFTAFARLKPGRTLQQAQQDLAAVQARLSQQFPATDRHWSAAILPLKEEQIAGVRRSLWLVFGAVVLVLMTACGNIALLMLADAARREQDVALQFALGASRRTIVGQRLREGAIVAIAGALGGLLIANWGVDTLRATAIALPRATELAIDARLVLFTLSVGVLTTLVFAWAPAMLATRSTTASRAAHGVRGQLSGRKRVQGAVMIVQIALAVVLLIGSGLLIRSFSRLQNVPMGFNPSGVLTFRVSAAWSERPSAVAVRQNQTLKRLLEVPGVTAAALTNFLPATHPEYDPGRFQILGKPADDRQEALYRTVSADYFRTLGIPLEAGRTCRDDPRAERPGEMLINRAFAARYFAGEDPIGRSLVRQTPNVIVGIAADARERSLTEEPQPVLYVCGLMPFYPDPYHLVRVDQTRPATMAALRAAMNEIEPERAVYSAMLLPTALSDASSQSRLTTLLLSLFAGMALLLVAIGLYGLLAQFVIERRQEIGVRMALGARPAQALARVVRHSAAITLAGVAIGLLGAFSFAQVMGALVFEISPRDPVTFAVAPLILAAISATATFLPAHRASRVDPLVALRYE